ncbi:MAG: hypothetical protein OHK0022_12930 [Roseiflexaceae bacterium]
MGKIISRIKQARLDYAQRLGRDVSIQEVATAIGITRAALRKIENDEAFVSRPVLASLCQFYGLQPGDLLKYEDRLARLLAVPQHDTSSRAETDDELLVGASIASLHSFALVSAGTGRV